MVLPRIFVAVLVFTAATTLMSKEERSAFSFQTVDYFHRWSQGTQHEFTPAKQEDLDHWTDMITINGYPGVDDGEKLAGAANAVLGNYRSHQGKILKTSSVPATDEQPAEHFIAVRFNQPEYDAGSQVSNVQSALAREGYYDGAIDGRLGPATQKALRRYQRDHGLPVTGGISRAVIEALQLR